MDRQKMGERIRKRREEIGLSQAGLARLLDIAQTQVNRYERGERVPRGPRLQKIARILRCKASWLRDED